MAEDKKKDEKADKAEKAEATPEEAAAKSKKKRLLLFIIAGVVLTAGIGGGAAFFLAGGSDSKMSAKTGEEHGEAKAEEHGEAKAEGHGEKKEEGHGEAKAEGHGEKKEEGHGEAKAEGHGEAKEGGHGEAAGAKKDDKKVAKLEGVDFGCTMDLKPFHLNLGNPLENRYIRVEVAVEYGCAEETKAEFEKRTPQLRDAIIAVTSRKTREFLLGPDGKEQLRKEIETQINQRMVSKIKDVYITDILIE